MNGNKMRDRLQQLYDKLSGRDVFVIGGGPSFLEVDKTKLDNKLVITINTAYKEFPKATGLYWCDESWAATHYDNIESHPCKLRFSARHSADGYITKNILGSLDSTILKRTGDFGIDPDINHVRGNNSGAHVINLLANIKVKRIILLGYDLSIRQGKTHWHGGHGLPMSTHIYDELFIPSISSMATSLKNMKIEVVNCSMQSALTCFKKEPLEGYL
jgi:hypothetical protein